MKKVLDCLRPMKGVDVLVVLVIKLTIHAKKKR